MLGVGRGGYHRYRQFYRQRHALRAPAGHCRALWVLAAIRLRR